MEHTIGLNGILWRNQPLYQEDNQETGAAESADCPQQLYSEAGRSSLHTQLDGGTLEHFKCFPLSAENVLSKQFLYRSSISKR